LCIAKKLIDVCASAGCNFVKFQKRTPAICVPEDQKNVPRETPWGVMSYLDYRYKVEFGKEEYDEIDEHCKSRGIKWTASAWDVGSLYFLYNYQLDFIKIPSALITDEVFLRSISKGDVPVILSTGMSTLEMIDKAVEVLGKDKIKCIMHCTSTYPAKESELNLNCIKTLKDRYGVTIGYSNHHPGLVYMPVAVSLGAEYIETHVTLDRAMWGSDHAASIEPEGIYRLTKYVRGVESSLGNGVKTIYDSELPIMKKLRKCA
jgi:N-acetylneuraminate synthase